MEDDESDNSSELAGLTRGAAKTAQSISKRAIIGRLPKPNVNANAAAAGAGAIKIRVPSASVSVGSSSASRGLLPKQLRIQRQVAKVTDKLSTAIDSYDALQSSNDGNGGNGGTSTNKGGSSKTSGTNTFTKMSGILDQMKGLATKSFPIAGGTCSTFLFGDHVLSISDLRFFASKNCACIYNGVIFVLFLFLKTSFPCVPIRY